MSDMVNSVQPVMVNTKLLLKTSGMQIMDFFLECRSVVINLKTEEIVIAPFKKFRNLNECPENDIKVVTEEIKNAKTVEITNKLDGSMQCVRWYNGRKSSCLAVRRLTLICRGD